jgi:hypothetical protein
MSRRASKQQSILVTPAIIQGRFSSSHYPGSAVFAANCRELSRAYRLSRGRPRLLAAVRLFGAVERHTRVLHQLRHERYKVVPYLIDLAGRSAAWLRAPEDFRPRTTHGRDQVAELVRYLFESYRVPRWLRGALTPKRGRPAQAPAFGWYVHVAQGQSLRSAPGLPLPLSRRAAHEALLAPARYPPQQALLYGYLRAHDAPAAVCTALLLAPRTRDLAANEPWLKLFEKIARTPDFPAHQVAPLLHYAQVRCAEGASLDVSVPTLLRGMGRWHAALRDAAVRQRALQYGPEFDQRWAASLPNAQLEGSCEHGDYTISELRSFRELFEEGQVMHHCVFTYAHAARAGTVSIWSLRITRGGHEAGRVTVRVTASERAVVEARRRCNYAIQPHERELLRRWADSHGLSLSPGV